MEVGRRGTVGYQEGGKKEVCGGEREEGGRGAG